MESWECAADACGDTKRLTRAGTTLCFLREFRAWHAETYAGAAGDGLGRAVFDARLRDFRDTTSPADGDLYTTWSEVIGFVGGELRYARIDARLTSPMWAPMPDRKACVRRANRLLAAVRRETVGLPGLSTVFHFSESWLWYKAQRALVDGLTRGIYIALPVAFLVLTFATQNVVLAGLAIVCIGSIVAGVLGLCYLLGWSLGIKESLAGVIVIGLAVDYTIHLGHMYDHARSHERLHSREDRVAYAMRKMGQTVFAGAVTTSGAASVMLACQLEFFKSMAYLIVFTILFSIFMAFFFFIPALWVFGPEGSQGNLVHIRKTVAGYFKSKPASPDEAPAVRDAPATVEDDAYVGGGLLKALTESDDDGDVEGRATTWTPVGADDDRDDEGDCSCTSGSGWLAF